MGRLLLIFLCICVVGVSFSKSQAYFRISADFTIKENSASGKEFYKGEVYFDKRINKIIYQISFPDFKKLVMADTQMYELEKEKIINQKFTPNTNRFSIFYLALSGSLKNYGLDKSGYYINSIEESGDQTIVEWLPPDNLKEKLGKVILSVKNNQLFGIVLFKPDGEMMGKRFYQEYVSVQGLPFPKKVIQVSYLHGEEYYKITTFENIKIDELENDEMYRVDLID